nr:uncharacterized protein LOC113694072 [Coffea arabica]
MCATAVLRSHDCLRKPYYTRRNTASHNNPNPSGSRRRKRSPTGFETNVHDGSRVVNPGLRKAPTSTSVAAKNNLVMGQVKILKRGEPLPVNDDDKNNNNRTGSKKAISTPIPATASEKLGLVGRCDEDDLILCSTGRLGPEPEMVQKQIRTSDFYAGSGPIVASPPPSSLPFPAFFSKKEKKFDEATSDLLRLLRLDLP